MNEVEYQVRIAKLISRHLTNEINAGEQAELDQWLKADDRHASLFEQITEPSSLAAILLQLESLDTEAALSNVKFRIAQQEQQPKTIRLWPRIAAAASVLLILGAGTFILLKKPKPAELAHDVAPYTAMAILKTGGKTIVLDKLANGKIAQTNVTKSAGEQLSYAPTAEPTAVYDTIQIPAGGRPYTVKLADGSQITLNAATTLRYPENFTKNKREQLELISGEIYAEIVHNPDAPLTIKAPGQLIEDIGTEFNVNAYPDESEKHTTLVEGAIKVNDKHLKPGEQTTLINGKLAIAPANLEQTIAWKKGDFYFKGEHIDVIMRQLARWYNIEVVYEGKMTDEVFYTQISRKKNISAVLKVLEKSNKVKFKIEGRRVTVLSKN